MDDPGNVRPLEGEEIWQHLHNMGYRPVDEARDTWAKPVGYSIYVFEVGKRRFSQRFRSAGDGSPLVWKFKEWDPTDSLTGFLAYVETFCTNRVTGEGHAGKPWDFRTALQFK